MNTLEITELLNAIGSYNERTAKLLHEVNNMLEMHVGVKELKYTLLKECRDINTKAGDLLCGMMSDKL